MMKTRLQTSSLLTNTTTRITRSHRAQYGDEILTPQKDLIVSSQLTNVRKRKGNPTNAQTKKQKFNHSSPQKPSSDSDSSNEVPQSTKKRVRSTIRPSSRLILESSDDETKQPLHTSPKKKLSTEEPDVIESLIDPTDSDFKPESEGEEDDDDDQLDSSYEENSTESTHNKTAQKKSSSLSTKEHERTGIDLEGVFDDEKSSDEDHQQRNKLSEIQTTISDENSSALRTTRRREKAKTSSSGPVNTPKVYCNKNDSSFSQSGLILFSFFHLIFDNKMSFSL
jgi:hypothetical protein